MKLSNKAYDILKTVCLVILPAAAALVTACGALWGLSDTMIKAIAGTITGLATVLGGVLGLSSSIYYDDQIPKPEPAPEPEPEPVAKIYLSPSGQSGNLYAAGDTNEREQCELIAAYCKDALEAHGFKVFLDPGADYNTRVAHAMQENVDVYIPIHTNAFDGKVSGTRMFVRSFESEPDLAICKAIFDRLDACCPGKSSNIKEYPTLWEFVHTVPIPGVYCECDFHDVPSVAEFIITHQKEIGESIALGLCDYFNINW